MYYYILYLLGLYTYEEVPKPHKFIRVNSFTDLFREEVTKQKTLTNCEQKILTNYEQLLKELNEYFRSKKS